MKQTYMNPVRDPDYEGWYVVLRHHLFYYSVGHICDKAYHPVHLGDFLCPQCREIPTIGEQFLINAALLRVPDRLSYPSLHMTYHFFPGKPEDIVRI